MTQLLRERLGFQGVIISDCMEMRAVTAIVGVEQGTVKALQAGVDLVLISHHAALQRSGIDAIYAALRNNILAPERVQSAADRVLQLKAHTLSWNAPSSDNLTIIGNEAHLRLRDNAYARSTTLVRDTEKLLPLRLQAEQWLLLLFLQPTVFSGAVDTEFAGDTLTEYVQQRHSHVDTLTITAQSIQVDAAKLQQAVDRAALVIAVTANANQDSYQGSIVQQLLHAGKPVIGIAAYNRLSRAGYLPRYLRIHATSILCRRSCTLRRGASARSFACKHSRGLFCRSLSIINLP